VLRRFAGWAPVGGCCWWRSLGVRSAGRVALSTVFLIQGNEPLAAGATAGGVARRRWGGRFGSEGRIRVAFDVIWTLKTTRIADSAANQ
jgi:hypothetical protein